jgi:hypothetical protein
MAESTWTWDPVAWLKTQHTKQLLQLRDTIHRVYGGYRISSLQAIGSETVEHEAGYNPFDDCSGGTTFVTLAQVKAELATRPHVPNKAEAKVIRQQKAKAKQNR